MTITSTKLYVPFVILSINDIKFLENIKQGFKKKTISWNKYRSEITTQLKNNNVDYLIDPTFGNINRLCVHSFKNWDDDPTISSFDWYYMPLIEIKDFNLLTEDKPIFNQPVENSKERMKNVLKFQEKMTAQQEIYYSFLIIKILINLLALIYQDKQI